MAACKVPNYITGRRGRNWSASLRAAERNGALIILAETGVRVYWAKTTPGVQIRPWMDRAGNRFDSRDCIPVF